MIYSNAALHWLDNHQELLVALLNGLKRGGVLAVQMPRNFGAPSHTSITETALDGPWRAVLEPLLRPSPVAEPAVYYDLLAPRAASLDIWETEYLQVLDGVNPVKEWTKGTWLSPLLAALDEPERSRFEAAYGERVAAFYPPRRDGKTLFPFRRMFLIAASYGAVIPERRTGRRWRRPACFLTEWRRSVRARAADGVRRLAHGRGLLFLPSPLFAGLRADIGFRRPHGLALLFLPSPQFAGLRADIALRRRDGGSRRRRGLRTGRQRGNVVGLRIGAERDASQQAYTKDRGLNDVPHVSLPPNGVPVPVRDSWAKVRHGTNEDFQRL